MKNVPYIIRLILFSACLALLVLAVEAKFPGIYIHKAIWGMFAFQFILTGLIHYMSVNALDKGNNAFNTAVMGSIGLKLFLSVAFIIFYLLYDRSNSIWFGINFILLYLFYTAFEIYSLLRNLRTLKK